jgi:hypothetical protein
VLVDVPLKPPERRAFVAFRVGGGEEFAKGEGVGEG